MKKTSETPASFTDMTRYQAPAGLLGIRFDFRPGEPVSDAEKQIAREAWLADRNGASELLESIHTALIHQTPEGYTVQFPGVGDGRTRHFRGVEHGSTQAALYAARDWRDSQAAGLEECVAFPKGQRVQWSDGELDAITERAAWIEQAVGAGWLPNRGYQYLHYVRMAIVQVLPWDRWRKMWQSRNIPYDITARFPSKRKEAAGRMKAYLKRTKPAESPIDTVGAHMPEAVSAEKKDTPKSPEPVPSETAPPAALVAPSADLAEAAQLRGSGTELGVVERFILLAMEARVGPFMREVSKRVDQIGAGLAALETQMTAFLTKAAQGLVPVSPGVPVAAAISDEIAKRVLGEIGEFKLMQDMIHDELQSVRRLSGDIEDGRDGVDTRLRELEATVFRLAKGGAIAQAVTGQPEPAQRPKVIPVIAIMGPLPDQFRQICDRVGEAAELVHLDNKHSAGAVKVPDRVEWAINNRFGTHAQEAGLKSALGAERVTYVAAGGISSMVRTVMEIVERVNRGGIVK